ncbi:MAG: hypothetical protein K1X89_32025, partial [Myxococcaceae bacterium]|nr:hypothetical protein [Myxococcaceae bacterium]
MKDSPLHALVVRKTGTALSNLQRERLDQAAAPHRQGRDERAFVDWLESPFGKAALDEILT